MSNKIRMILKKFFLWIFREEINGTKEEREEFERKVKFFERDLKRLDAELFVKYEKLDNMLNNLDISVDHHIYSKSWAVISIQGKRQDFIKFIDLGEKDIQQISNFLKNFDRTKIDASPEATKLIRFL